MIGRRMPYYVKRGIGGIDANTVLMLHGEDFTDASQYKQNIANYNTELVSGYFAKAFNFSAISQYIIIPNLLSNLTEFTIDFWIYPTSSNNNCFFGQGDAAGNSQYMTRINDSCLWFDIAALNMSGSYAVTKSIGLNAWSHGAIVKNGTSIACAVNGIFGTWKTILSNIPTSTYYTVIGRHAMYASGSVNFIGMIDEFRISNIARWTANFTPPTEPYSK